jgi:hypothetical protein
MGDITMVRGEEYPIEWRFKSDSVTPKNLTGYSALIEIRPYEGSTTLIQGWTHLSPEVVFTPLAGTVKLTIPQHVSKAFTFKTAVMDCWVYLPNSVDGDRSPLEYITLQKGSAIT